MMKMSHDKQMKNKFLRKTNDERNMKMMKNKLFMWVKIIHNLRRR